VRRVVDFERRSITNRFELPPCCKLMITRWPSGEKRGENDMPGKLLERDDEQLITYMEFGQGDPACLLVRIETATQSSAISRHVVLAAFLAGWPARDHELAAGRQFEPVRDGSAFEVDHAPHRHSGDRYLAVLCARWGSHMFRIRPPVESRRSM